MTFWPGTEWGHHDFSPRVSARTTGPYPGRYHRLVQARIVNGAAGNAVLDGGPLDGREHPVEPDTTELVVVMEDGARHLYTACQRVQPLPDGRVAPVFEYRGRDYPLRSSDT